MIAGSIGKLGETYSISVRVISVSTGEILKDVSETYKGSIDNLLEEQIPNIAKRLAGQKVKQNNHFWLYAGLGTLMVIGGVTAYYIKTNEADMPPNKTEADIAVRW